MLLRAIGLSSPLAVIFTGIAAGICLAADQYAGLAFASLMLVLLFSLPRLPHMIIGFLLGLTVCSCAPRSVWLEGEYALSGRITSAGFEHGLLRIELSDLRVADRSVSGRARLNVYDPCAVHRPYRMNPDMGLTGCYLKGTARLTPPRSLGNSGESDYALSLLVQGITVTGFIKDLCALGIGEREGKGGIRERMRMMGAGPAVRILNDLARPEAEILKAMLIGDRSGLSAYDQDTLAALGISHIIAISGLNIGLMVLFGYVLAFTFFRSIPPLAVRIDTPLVSKIIGLCCALLYGMIITPAFPSMRAIIMALMLICALLFLRRLDLLDALALAGILIVLIWPFSLFSTSFLLSFAAVLGIVLVMQRVRHASLTLQYIAVTVAASGFTLPIAGYIFGFVAPFTILHNLVFVPLFSFIVMPLGMIGLVLSAIDTQAALPVFSFALDAIGCMRWVGAHWGMLMPLPRPPIAWVFLCYLGLILAFLASGGRREETEEAHFFPRWSPKLHSVLLVMLCVALVLIPVHARYLTQHSPLTFDFISVGQGDSCLITRGKKAVLVDAGGTLTGFDTGRFVVAPHLLRRGITRLDLVVITHSHPDHAGGMPFILKRFPVGQVWINAEQDPGFQDVLRVTTLKSIPLRVVERGDALNLDGLRIRVLHPQARLIYRKNLDLNLHSIVLKAGDATMTGLFMADAHFFGELTLLHNGEDLAAQVLKVAHHGSAGSCLDLFLAEVDPRMAVISCGYRNRYGMPTGEVLERLRAHGIRVWRTDRDGEIRIVQGRGSSGIKSKPYRADERQR